MFSDNNFRIITAPVLLPDTPDCDYANGEFPLTSSQILHLQTSFNDYQIIDYNHQFCYDSEWQFKTIGVPLKSWISNDTITYTDITETKRTIPAGSWWLKCKITDPEAIKQIDEQKLTAYSLTTANKTYADKIMQMLNQNTNNAQKNNEDKKLKELAEKTRTLIKDIKDPVGFTVSLTDFPCVPNAFFAKKCLEKSGKQSKKNKEQKRIQKGDKMTEKTKYSIEELKSILNIFSNKTEEKTTTKETRKEEEKPEKEKTTEYATKEELNKITNQIKEINKVIEELVEKIDKIKEKPEKEPETTTKEPETTANKNTQTKEIQHKHDGINNTSYKHKKPEVYLMEKLGRDQYGITKFKN